MAQPGFYRLAIHARVGPGVEDVLKRGQDGPVYRGEFVGGHREGIGVIEIRAIGVPDDTNIRAPVPGVYVG
jgi:hypothetical protein